MWMTWGGRSLAMSLVGPRDLCWSLAHIQQRPGGGQLYWLHFPPPRPPGAGKAASILWSVRGAQPVELEPSLGRQGIWALRVSGTVGVWT